MSSKRSVFNIPPIGFVIAGALCALIGAVMLIVTFSSSLPWYQFKSRAELTTATCSDITFYTTTEDGEMKQYYTVTVKYKANLNDMESSFMDTDSSLARLRPGDDIVIYYSLDDKYEVRPAYQMPSRVWAYILYALVMAGGVVLFVYNLKTILRSRVPYAKKLVHENDVTEMYTDGKTDPYADIGLSDSSIDYAAQADSAANGTESYSDPFAVYTGYGEQQQTPAAGQYFDPNAGYTPDMPQQTNVPAYSQEDLNNPFISQVNNDPNSPFNQGGYAAPAVQQQYSTMPEQPAVPGQYYDPNSSYDLGHYADDSTGFKGNV